MAAMSLEQVARKVDHVDQRLGEHIRQHARDAAALASRRQVHLNIVLAVLSPIATAALMRVFHLG